MRGVIAAFILVAVLVVDRTQAHPRCPSMKEYLKDFLMKAEDTMGEKMEMMKKMPFGCIEAARADEMNMSFQGTSCMLIEVVPRVLRAVLKGDVPNRSEIQQIWLTIQKCTISEFGFIDDNGNLKFDEVEDKNQAVKGDDMDRSNRILGRCITKQKKDERNSRLKAEVSQSAIFECYLENAIEYCQKQDEDLGPLPVIYAINSMYKDGECPVVVPKKLEEVNMKCLVETDKEMMRIVKTRMANKKEESPLQRGVNRMFRRNQRREQMKKEWKQMKEDCKNFNKMLFKCTIVDMGIATDDGMKLDTAKYMSYLTNELTGWEDKKLKEVTKAITDCYGADTTSVDFINMLEDKDAMKKHMEITMTCLLPKYVKTCGMNNQLTEFFHMMFNENVAEKVLKMMKNWVMNMVKMKKFPMYPLGAALMDAGMDSQESDEDSSED